MSELKIWAPAASQVEVALPKVRRPMHAIGDGWWSYTADDLVHGIDYEFWLDGDGPFPDPKSASQPHGIHGPSRWVDHSEFAWDDSNWEATALPKAIIYELHIGTFTPEGTFTSAISRLGELQALGITHVEIMPVAEFAGTRGWGYDGVDLYAPHHLYGGPDGLKQLVNACHQHKLGVILDVVYNHLGPEGNYIEKFAPYFKPDVKTPWGNAVNLDGPGSEHVRRFFIDNALMWLRDYHFDGLRLDATHAFVDKSKPHFLAQLTTEVKTMASALDRYVFLIAESDLNDPVVVKPVEEGGWGFDAQGNEDFHHALHTLLTGEDSGYFMDYGTVEDLGTVLKDNFCLYERYSRHRKKMHGFSAKGIDRTHFVACIQNHDQTGNRGRGERINHLVEPGLVKVAAACTLLSPFIPLLFQGEEWLASSPFLYFSDVQNPATREAIRKERKREFAFFHEDSADLPDPLAEATWRQSQLVWDEREAEAHLDMLAWYKALIHLRKQEADFAPGQDCEDVEYEESSRWLSFRRGRFRVVCNFSRASQLITSHEKGELFMTSKPAQLMKEAGQILVPAHSVVILEHQAEQMLQPQGAKAAMR